MAPEAFLEEDLSRGGWAVRTSTVPCCGLLSVHEEHVAVDGFPQEMCCRAAGRVALGIYGAQSTLHVS